MSTSLKIKLSRFKVSLHLHVYLNIYKNYALNIRQLQVKENFVMKQIEMYSYILITMREVSK